MGKNPACLSRQIPAEAPPVDSAPHGRRRGCVFAWFAILLTLDKLVGGDDHEVDQGLAGRGDDVQPAVAGWDRLRLLPLTRVTIVI
jgi:hypothetical protein